MTHSQVINSLDSTLIPPLKSAPVDNCPGAMKLWKITSLDSLSLSIGNDGPFADSDQQISLNKDQLNMLPKSLLKKVYEGYSRAVNRAGLSVNLGKMSFSVEGKTFRITEQGGKVHRIPLEADAKFRKTMNEVVDKSRILLPDSFVTAARTLPTFDANPIRGKVESSAFNFGLLSEVNLEANKAIGTVISTAGLVVSGIGVALGTMYMGMDKAIEGRSIYKKANENGDTEGKVNGALTMGVGTAFVVTGMGAVTSALPNTWSFFEKVLASVPDLTIALTTAGHAGILLMGGCMLAKGAYEIYHLDKFRDNLTEILDREKILEEEKAKQGLVFLEQQISITEGDLLNLKEKFKDKSVLDSEIEKLLKVKWERFVRRVGEECAHKVSEQIGTIRDALFVGDEDGIAKAIDLIQAVDQASYKIKVKNVIQVVLSIFYLCVGILAMATPFGFVTPLLSLVGFVIYMIINSDWVHQFVSKLIFNMKSDLHEKRWIKPLADRTIVHLFKSEFKEGRNWNLNKLKTEFKSALNESNGKIILGDMELNSFDKVCQKIHLHGIDFESLAFHEGELTLEQIKSLKILEEFITREWKLHKLKTELEAALEASDAKVFLNGVQIRDFETLCKKLQLEQIDFERESLRKVELSREQIRSLQFLDQLRMGVVYIPESDATAVEIQATFDPESCEGKIEIVTNTITDVETA